MENLKALCIDLYPSKVFEILLSQSELVFLGIGATILIVTTGLINYMRLLLSRLFVFISICIVGWYLIIEYFNNKTVLTFIQQSTLKTFFIFVVSFLLILYAYYKDKYLITGVDYVLTIMLAVLGMSFLMYTQNLLLWFMAIELISTAFYALASYRTNRSFLQSEGGLKYFFFGSIASSLYLYGLSILYFITGRIELDQIAVYLYFETNSEYMINVAIFLIFISLFFKIGIAPFHLWAPQVYTSSSVIIAFFLQLLPKIPLVYILYMLIHFEMKPIYYVGVISSIVIGSIYAFYFTPVKTFIAYSGIANNAFIIAPLLGNTILAFSSFLSYIFIYNIILVIFFTSILFTQRLNNLPALHNLRDFIILKKSNPFIGIAFTIVFLNFAGIPPFAGFFSKIIVLMSTLSYSLYTINFLLLLFAILSIYYYIRVIKIIYFSSKLNYAGLSTISAIPSYMISIGLYITLGFIFFPSIFFDYLLWSV